MRKPIEQARLSIKNDTPILQLQVNPSSKTHLTPIVYKTGIIC